ncbi:hypothetical protein CEXT_514241 [Caerostris extrusa]|uniref:Uncharacterized protein n=1 Tax=Caerostris extrusa TaxID=172846 RepID=A0AAV4V0U1_CAEEX|nr:hypothetical protein CEXT_514241 [Caerostris extrusa]
MSFPPPQEPGTEQLADDSPGVIQAAHMHQSLDHQFEPRPLWTVGWYRGPRREQQFDLLPPALAGSLPDDEEESTDRFLMLDTPSRCLGSSRPKFRLLFEVRKLGEGTLGVDGMLSSGLLVVIEIWSVTGLLTPELFLSSDGC